jgi:hypothetical protein
MEILLAIDDLDDLVHESPHVPLTDLVRIDAHVAREATGRVRAAATDLFGALRARSGPTGDVFMAIDELETLVATAGRIPMSKQLRIDKDRVFDLLDRLRVALPNAIAESRGANPVEPARNTETLAALDALGELVFESRKAVFSDCLRVDENALRDASFLLRRSVGELSGPAGAQDGPTADALAALDDLVRAARRVRLTNQLCVPRGPLHNLLDRLHVTVPQVGSTF